MNMHEEYKQKLVSAEQAAALVRSGDWIDYGWCVGTPVAIDKALAKRMPELSDVKIRGGVLVRKPAIFEIENPAEHFCWNSWHLGGWERKAVSEGFGFFNPMRYAELPRFYREDNIEKPAVAFLQVAPMDEHGYFNFGPQASHLAAMCASAAKVVVEVNKNQPVCLGGYQNAIHISDVDYIVEGENDPMQELGAGAPPTEVDREVARLIVEQIPNGACLQLGIGGMPNTVGSMIAASDLKDLGVHTEMYVDAFVDLYDAGKITNLKKPFDKGREVYAFAAGTKKLYDHLNNNPGCMSVPVDYTNDPYVIGQIDNFISINNAVDMDLFGQVNAESAGPKLISGTGGQLDFVLGAYLSKGGKSFICMSSSFETKTGERKSRIRATLTPGSIVSDPRSAIHYLVTEYGMVNLKGVTNWQRAERIISIAHPDFRDELIQEAEKMHIWRKSNKR